MALIPPANYGLVEEELSRSGEPHELNFPFMEKLALKAIIYLSPEEPNPTFLNFCYEQSIRLLHIGKTDQSSAGKVSAAQAQAAAAASSSFKPLNEDIVIAALNAILMPSNYPLHVMCSLGTHRTGTIIGCLRKLQRWNLSSIFAEYRRYAVGKVRQMNEQFIELFDTDLVAIPKNPPKWLSIYLSGLASAATPVPAPAPAVLLAAYPHNAPAPALHTSVTPLNFVATAPAPAAVHAHNSTAQTATNAAMAPVPAATAGSGGTEEKK
jgi:tyrosine-protein phosphatase OCA1